MPQNDMFCSAAILSGSQRYLLYAPVMVYNIQNSPER